MQRRNFIKSSVGTLAIMGLGSSALAQSIDEKNEKLVLTEQISRNHGHKVNLQIEDLVLLLRDINSNGPATLNIQGDSGHPHTITLENDQIMSLLLDGELVVRSSRDAGHAHGVRLQLLPPNE